MIVQKIRFVVRDRNGCLEFNEKYIVVHSTRPIEEFENDYGNWKKFINEKLSDVELDDLFQSDYETWFNEFWIGLGYYIVYDNDEFVKKCCYRESEGIVEE